MRLEGGVPETAYGAGGCQSWGLVGRRRRGGEGGHVKIWQAEGESERPRKAGAAEGGPAGPPRHLPASSLPGHPHGPIRLSPSPAHTPGPRQAAQLSEQGRQKAVCEHAAARADRATAHPPAGEPPLSQPSLHLCREPPCWSAPTKPSQRALWVGVADRRRKRPRRRRLTLVCVCGCAVSSEREARVGGVDEDVGGSTLAVSSQTDRRRAALTRSDLSNCICTHAPVRVLSADSDARAACRTRQPPARPTRSSTARTTSRPAALPRTSLARALAQPSQLTRPLPPVRKIFPTSHPSSAGGSPAMLP